MLITESTPAFIAGPNKKLASRLLELGKRDLRMVVGLLTGHCHLNRHKRILGISETGTCRKCGEEEESPLHILCRCPALTGQRLKRLSAYFMGPREVAELPLRSLMSYIRHAGLE